MSKRVSMLTQQAAGQCCLRPLRTAGKAGPGNGRPIRTVNLAFLDASSLSPGLNSE